MNFRSFRKRERTSSYDPPVDHAIYRHPRVFAAAVEKTDAVAVVQVGHILHHFPHRLGRSQRGHAAGTPAMKEIGRETTIETFFESGNEGNYRLAE